jgi:hypothetical protein
MKDAVKHTIGPVRHTYAVMSRPAANQCPSRSPAAQLTHRHYYTGRRRAKSRDMVGDLDPEMTISAASRTGITVREGHR